MVEYVTLRLFYPMLFATIIVLGIIVGLVITKTKDNGLFNNIFNKHTDEHIDTTDKLSKAHTEVVEAKWDNAHEKELDYIEKKIDKIEKDIIEINDKLDAFIQKVIELEKRK